MRTFTAFAILVMVVAPPSVGGDEIFPSLHPGFESGVPLGRGIVQSSIGLGDIDEDGLPEIVVGGNDGVLYAFNGDGTPVVAVEKTDSILDATPGALFKTPDGSPILSSPTLADVDLDNRVDLFWGTDGGEVYHLELRLTSDPPLEIKRRNFRATFPIIKNAATRKQATPEEGDDIGWR
jgi:hypothetical protein